MGEYVGRCGPQSSQIAPRDAANIYGETDRSPATIVDAYVFDGGGRRLTDGQVLEWMAERTHASPVLTSTLHRVWADLEYPSWVQDPAFDLRNHVTVVAGDTDWESARWILSGLVHARMDLTMPPWGMTVVQGVSGMGEGIPDDATLVVFRFHHSIGDGVATASLARQLFDIRPPVPADPPARNRSRWRPPPVVALPRNLVRYGSALVAGILTAQLEDRAVRRGEIPAEGPSPRTRFDRKLAGVPRIAVLYFDLAELRAVRASVEGATINDVVLTVVGGAMAAYLTETGERPAGSLSTKMPIALADDTGSENRFALALVDLHTDATSSRERLRLVSGSTRAAKDRQKHPVVAARRSNVRRIPAIATRFAGFRTSRPEPEDATTRTGNTLISNVPTDRTGATFCGAPIVATFGALTLSDGDGLAHFVSSVGDRLSLTVTADSATMPDLDHYERLLRSEFERLLAEGLDEVPSAP
ncbi:wax ester/triacylglycerol synthase domain-containing protein [Rhodococcus gannanensis]|uniref:diacylglycerol O-acyltransferase n=1 Tax=Rhodococcus gannanensis TaxID=1960308 RepID=A0ABW4P8E2_9NOCA